MALGDNEQKNFEPTYYSNLGPRNYDNHTAIGISFSTGLMKIAIQKENEQHKYDTMIEASLPPKKATILLHEMNAMEESGGDDSRACGVVVGLSSVQTAIAFQIVNGVKHLRIAKVNQDGSIKEQKAYEFANGVDSGLQWSDFDSMKYSKDIIDDIDYVMLKAAIEEFARGQSGAYAYGAFYMNRYSEKSLSTRVNAIMDKLGIERQSGNSNFQRGGGFFSEGSNNSAARSEHKSYSDISSMLDDEDE